MNGNPPTSETTTASTDGVLVALGNTRSAIRRALVTERLSQAIAFGLLAVVVAVVLDRLLRLPPFIRVIELAMLVGGRGCLVCTQGATCVSVLAITG